MKRVQGLISTVDDANKGQNHFISKKTFVMTSDEKQF